MAQFFGLLGGNNDINVLDWSHIIQNLLNEATNDSKFIVTRTTYPWYYLLIHGIYPQWSCFVQTIHKAQDAKKMKIAKMQEGARKDVEQCFGVLQAHFGIIQNSYKLWKMDTIYEIMTTCVIFHNMIIKDERDYNFESLFDLANARQWQHGFTFQRYMEGISKLENTHTHLTLKSNLVEHLWAMNGLH